MLDWECKEVKKVLKREDFIIEGFIYMSKFPEFIFKGASLLAYVNKNISSSVFRETKDVDITNIGINKDELKSIMENFIIYLEKKYDLDNFIIKENEKTEQSNDYYTVDFVNKKSGQIEFNIDFSVAAEYGQGFLYHTEIKDIIGYNINKIFSDKMSTISTKQIFSRIKDFVDLYNISLNDEYRISYNEICRYNELNEDFNVGDFRQLLTMKDNIRKAFNKMKNIYIKDKRDRNEIFDIMHSRVVDFVAPFIGDNKSLMRDNAVWDKDVGAWVYDK